MKSCGTPSRAAPTGSWRAHDCPGDGVRDGKPRFVRPAPQAGARHRGSLSPATRWALRLTSLIAIAVAWELYGSAINPVLLSSPTAIIGATFEMIADGTLLKAMGESFVVLGVGSLIGVTVGLVIGLAAGRRQVFATLIELPLNALYATPTVALIPVIVVWFGFGRPPRRWW